MKGLCGVAVVKGSLNSIEVYSPIETLYRTMLQKGDVQKPTREAEADCSMTAMVA